MKKFFLSFICFLTACSSIFGYDKEFKNPIFNQPLEPLSKTVGYEYLTPNSVEFKGLLYKDTTIYTGKCDLIENKQDRITLKCRGEWDDGTKYDRYFTYIVKNLYTPNCLRILEYEYREPKDFPKDEMFAAKFCVTPPDYIESKSD